MIHKKERKCKNIWILVTNGSSKKMFKNIAIPVKSQCQQLCLKLCLQSNTRMQKYSSNKASTNEAVKIRSNWWNNFVSNAFGKYLLITNTITCGISLAFADLIHQEVEHKTQGKHQDSFDWHRNKNMATIGSLQGPFIHFFYRTLDKYFSGNSMNVVAQKIILDQTVASPFCILLFFLGLNYLNNEKFETSRAEVKKKFWIVYVADCFLWIPAQIFNFYVLPSHYRVIYINILTMCYNIFLSFIKHSSIVSPLTPPPPPPNDSA